MKTNQFVLTMSMANVKKVSSALKLIKADDKPKFLKKFIDFRENEYRDLTEGIKFPEIISDIDMILDKLKRGIICTEVYPKILILRDSAAEEIERISNYPDIDTTEEESYENEID